MIITDEIMTEIQMSIKDILESKGYKHNNFIIKLGIADIPNRRIKPSTVVGSNIVADIACYDVEWEIIKSQIRTLENFYKEWLERKPNESTH